MQNLSGEYFVKVFHYKAGARFVSLLENTDKTQGLIQIKHQIDNSFVFSNVETAHIPSGGLEMSVHGLLVHGNNDYWAYIQVGTEFKMAKLSATQVQWITFPLLPGSMNFALVLDTNQGYYCGGITTINSLDPTTRTYTHSHQVGYIMPYTINADSCVKGGSYTLTTAVTITQAYTITTQSLTTTSWGSSVSNEKVYLEDSGLSISSISPHTTATHAWCTLGQTITAITMTDMTYYVNSAAITSTPHGNFDSGCADQVFTVTLELLVGGVPQPSLPSFVSYNSFTKIVTVSTTSSGDAGTHTMRIKGVLNNLQESYAPFSIIIIYDPCRATVITPGTFTTPQTYNMMSGTPLILHSTTTWTESVGTCGSFTFTILKSDGSADDTLIFSFSGTDLQVQTANAAKIGSYSMKIQGVLGTYGNAEIPFTVNVVDACATMSLITSIIPTPQTYIVQTGSALTLGTAAWTMSAVVCGPINYSLIDTDSGTTADGIFSLSLGITGGNVVVNTNNISKARTYNLKLYGDVTGYTATNQVLFQVIVKDDCASLIISSSGLLASYSYDIQSNAAQTLVLNPFTLSSPGLCAQVVTYQLRDIDTSATADSTVFTLSTGNIQVNTQNPIKVKTYNLRLIATLTGYPSINNQENFQINVQDSCDGVSIIPGLWITPQIYDIQFGGSVILGSTNWSKTIVTCPALSYTLIDQGTTFAPDATVFTDSAGNLSVSTNLRSKMGSYTIVMTAFVQSSFKTYDTKTRTMVVNVIDSCDTTTITTVPFATPQNYEILQPLLVLGSATWTQTEASCNVPITYTLQDIGTGTLNPIFIIDASDQVAVSGALTTDVALYKLRLFAEITSSGGHTYTTNNVDFNVNVYACQLAVISPFQILDQDYYIVLSGLVNYPFPEWTESTNLCGPFTYTMTVSPSASFITYSSKTITVLSNSVTDAGDYTVSITGSIPFPQTATISFIVHIILVKNDPPYFQVPLQDQTIYSGNKAVYQLPQIVDDQGDIYQELVVLATASLFSTFSTSTRKIYMQPLPALDSGEFEVSIILQDFNKFNPKNETYNFKIFVIKREINETLNEILQVNNTYNPNITAKSKVVNKEDIHLDLDVWILDISCTGTRRKLRPNEIVF